MLTKNKFQILVIIFITCLPSLLYAQAVPVPAAEKKDSILQFDQAVEAANRALAVMQADLEQENRALKEAKTQDPIYRTQINSLRNFLLVPDISITTIEKGIEDVDISISIIQSKIQKMMEKQEKFRQAVSAVKDKIRMIDQRIQESKSSKDRAVDRDGGVNKLNTYVTVLHAQQKVLLETMAVLTHQINAGNGLLNSFEDIRMILGKEIKDKKGRRLFQRNEFQITTFQPQSLKAAMTAGAVKIGQLFTKEHWAVKQSQLKEHVNLSGTLIIFIFLGAGFFVYQALCFVRQKKGYTDILEKRTGYPVIVFEKSLWLVFWILLVTIFSKTQAFLVFPDLIKFLKPLLIVVLITRLTSDSIYLIVNEKGPVFFKALYQWRNIFVWGIRGYAFVYLFFFRFLSLESAVITTTRIVSEAILAAGILLFWKAYKKMDQHPEGIEIRALATWSKIVVFSGLFADISGYGYFASWWFISWGKTIMIVCIGILLVYSLKDADLKLKEKFKPESRNAYDVSYPFYWILSNGIYFFIIASAITLITLSWSVSDDFFAWIWQVFNQKHSIGKLELSIAGFAYSFVLILLTYLFTRLWKKAMADHVLKDSGLSTGARESVITISIYIVWSIGILISLSVLGLSTTSMTVVFGALGIGLGFGLQNIFNNFISGLILLFERPIQVGDIVDVGGQWGEVKKINVRSTLVQTYTNSSLIIPNSEFISAKVTNWSHKDPFIRRDLSVGVAYGSNTQLVRTLLLQASESVAEVYDYPQKARVQFINFGESSLDFRLRFWSDIDNFIEAESALRFEIDRLFRENGVVIPFPQRDLHILRNPDL